MPKIIFVNRFFFPDHSATSQLLSEASFFLARKGYDVHVLTSRQLYENPDAELPAEEDVSGIKVRRVWSSRFGRQNLGLRAVDYMTFYLSAMGRLLVTMSRGDTIIAKTDPPLISIVAAFAVLLRGGRLINWIQDLFPEVASALGLKGIRLVGPMLRGLRNLSLRMARSMSCSDSGWPSI